MNLEKNQKIIRKSTSFDSLKMFVTVDSSNKPSKDKSIVTSFPIDLKNRRKSILPTSHLPQTHEKPNPINVDPVLPTHYQDQVQNEMPAPQVNPKVTFSTEVTEKQACPETNLESTNDDSFDLFILDHFIPFSGHEDVNQWLDDTETKFNQL